MAEAQESISSREFAEWKAFDRISPIGDLRGDWQAALLASVTANVFSGGGRKHQPGDFLLSFGPKVYRSPKDVGLRIMGMFKRIKKRMQGHNGDDDR